MAFDRDLFRRRLSFVRQGADTVRFHTKNTLKANTVGYHSFGVAWICVLLTPGASPLERATILQAALEHDLFEHVSGDMPGDAKREMGVRDIVNAFEAEGMAAVGFRTEDLLNAAQKRTLKIADMFDGALYCISERSLGNQQISNAYHNFRNYIDQLEPASVMEVELCRYIDELWDSFGGTPRTVA